MELTNRDSGACVSTGIQGGPGLLPKHLAPSCIPQGQAGLNLGD